MSEAPQAPVFQPTPEYLARARRMDDAIHLRKPDRVPVAPLVVHFYAARLKGISNRDAMYDQNRAFAALKKAFGDRYLYAGLGTTIEVPGTSGGMKSGE